MQSVSNVVEWQYEEMVSGDLTIIGKVRVSAQAILKSEVRNDEHIYEYAKREVIERVYREMYGDMDRRLARLEQMLMIVLPPQEVIVYPNGSGPMAIVRELQAELQARR